MNPTLILAFVQLAIKAAPAAKQVYEDGKALAEHLFHTGLITKEKQDELMAWADEHQRATLAGEKPSELNVEPS